MDHKAKTAKKAKNTKTDKKSGIEAMREEARQILDLATSSATTMLPDDLFNYRTGNMLSIFLDIKVTAFFLSGLQAELVNLGQDKTEELIEKILLIGYVAHDAGADHYAKKTGLTLEFVKEYVDFGELTEEGMQFISKEYTDSSHIIYYTLALAQLCNFYNKFKRSFHKWDCTRREQENSLRLIVDSAGHLLSAQNLFRRGNVEQEKSAVSLAIQAELKSYQTQASKMYTELLMGELKKDRSERGKKAVNARHSQKNGSRDKRQKIKDIWATGKYSSKTACAERECDKLGMSFTTARKALINEPEPERKKT